MPHDASAIPADFYDHEQDAPSGGRRRIAPDWGGDDLFTSAPRRRRFDRPPRGDHSLAVSVGASRGDHASDVSVGAIRGDHASDVSVGAIRGDHASDVSVGALRGDHASDVLDRFDVPPGGDTVEHPAPTPAAAARAAAADRAPRMSLEIPPELDPGPSVRRGATIAPNGRRTVTVTGHPERGYGVSARRRPAPTLDERLIGSRPDRVAMYAFALGVLLIVIAFLSANA